ncbi:nitroreductase family deazaflavin-dependent oxidoreductase [Streptomyces sp. G-G2]|uniref:nitroreductase family deazaflavin-dependent oxidoreductase n=1 Tax=Streptomyces sp. G-G2 TaxID=3046201 RepID=UPI0024BBE474|nr:nitroreductase family deazaflavin-dependent oxidoreductase [Streptomyces sp. G-G2]MDJ0384128.1 nitroreductase family deazaflavin-dependent oxidoreductase [Streptomyces sp. G-G2]
MHSLDIDWNRPADPPGAPQRDHVRAYVSTGGTDGHLWHGVPTLLLTTIGRATGRTARTPLIYAEDEDRLIVAASGYGAPAHPDWYANLTADPRVRVQRGPIPFPATARPATPAEREAYWPVLTALWPPFDDDQSRTSREIPLVIIER